MKIKASNANQPCWKPIAVKSNVPAELGKLEELMPAAFSVVSTKHSSRSVVRTQYSCSSVLASRRWRNSLRTRLS